MRTVRCRWILISGVCSAILLCTLYMVQLSTDGEQSFEMISEYHKSTDGHGTLLDLQDFRYIMNNVTLCRSSAVGNQSSIIIVVHTARSNFVHRYAVRETWGSIKLYKGWTFHLVFLLGNDPTGNDGLDTRLWEEFRQHGDMVMGNFVDSYDNLTYKNLMGCKWVTSYCSNTKLVLKTDDDVFVDVFHLVEVILIELMNSNYAYACQKLIGLKPMRSPGSKWYVSEELYPGEEYPAYCIGYAYLMKTPVAAKIYSVCNQTKFFWIDDVHVTGTLRENYNILMNYNDSKRLDILPVDSRFISNWGDDLKLWCKTGLNEQLQFTFVLLAKDEVVRDMFCVWNKVRLLKFAVNHAIESNT